MITISIKIDGKYEKGEVTKISKEYLFITFKDYNLVINYKTKYFKNNILLKVTNEK